MKYHQPFCVLLIAVLVCGVSSAAESILQEDFDGASAASLGSKGWVFETGGSEEFGAMSRDDFMRIGGKTDSPPAVTKPLGADVANGMLEIVMGSTTSHAGIHVRVMDGDTELFNLEVKSKNEVAIHGKQSKLYNKTTRPGLDVSVLGKTTKGYQSHLVASFTWSAQPDGSGSSLSCTLDQPESTDAAKFDNLKVDGLSFKADGVPDKIIIETTAHDATSRDVLIFDISVERNSPPEPA